MNSVTIDRAGRLEGRRYRDGRPHHTALVAQAFKPAFWLACSIAILLQLQTSLLAAPSLRQVVERAGAYAKAYGAELANVIADEEFLQELVSRRDGSVVEHRTLQSEIAFVDLAGNGEWLAFRSVLRVDGAAVADAAGQLERVFRETPPTALARARTITAESARYNLGPIQRNFNVPTTVLQFILPQHQDRFRFRKIGEERVEGERDSAWVVEFREQRRSTFVRTPQGRDAPADGKLWVMPADGRIVRSRLVVNADVQAQIDVEWKYDGKLALWVPAEMRESYRGSGAARDTPVDVRGVARYSNYRRFQVDTRIIR